jgi:hypothetical protein
MKLDEGAEAEHWPPPMNTDDILVENLRATLDRTQRYMVWGLGSSLFLLLLTLAEPGPGEKVQLPGGFIPAEPGIVALVVTAVYWVAGALATFGVARANRIIGARQARPEILEAALTYPSLPTIRVHGPRIGAALLPPILFLWAFFQESGLPDSSYSWIGLLILLAPYGTLAFELRRALGGLAPDEHGD